MHKSNGKVSSIRTKAKAASSIVQSAKHKSKELPVSDCEEESDGVDAANLSIDFDYPDTSTVPKASDNVMRSRSSNDPTDPCANAMQTDDIDQSDYLLRKINNLSLKLSEVSQLLKERDAEIKRFKSTSISELRF